MRNRLLSGRNLGLLILVFIFFLVLTRLPLERVYQNVLENKAAGYARYISVSILVIISCCFIAHRYNLQAAGGFICPHKRNYWMMLLPMFYPGVLFLNNISGGCLTSGSEWRIMFFIVLIRAMMEEVLFRGLIQGYLLQYYSLEPRFRVVFTSASVFAIFHFIGLMSMDFMSVLTQVIYALMVGLLFGSLVLRVRNVWLVGVVHGILNLIAKDCNGVNDVSQPVDVREYFLNFLVLILILSPTLLISWLLINTDPSRKAKRKELLDRNT